MAKVINKDFWLKVSGLQCPHWTTVALWTLGILVMTGLTFKDLCPILHDYFDPDANLQVKIETKPGDKANPPVLYLCVPLISPKLYNDFSIALWNHLTKGSQCSECDFMSQYAADVWKDCPNITDTPYEEEQFKYEAFRDTNLQQCFVDALLNNNSTKEGIFADILDYTRFSAYRPLIHYLVRVLGDMAKWENDILLLDDITDLSETASYSSRYNLKELDELNSLLISVVCKLIYIKNSQPDDNCFELIRDSFVVWHLTTEMDTYGCMQLSLSSEEYIDVQFGAMYFDDYMNDERRRFRIFTENPAHVYKMAPLYSSPEKGLDTVKAEKVAITYSQQSVVVEERPQKKASCYDETSKNACMRQCRIINIESKCDCRLSLNGPHRILRDVNVMNETSTVEVPATLKTLKNQEYGDSQLIHRCSQQNRSDVTNCSEHCELPCESASFQWQVSTDEKIGDIQSSIFSLRLERRDQPYLEFTMNVRDSKEDLISKVGGVLNFYLGLSGLSIVFFLIYIFDCGRRFHGLKQDQTDRREDIEGRRFSAGLWRFRWLQLADYVSKESELKAENLELKNSSKESETAHKHDTGQLGDLVKMVKDMQAREQTMVKQMKEFQLRLSQHEIATMEKHGVLEQSGPDVPKGDKPLEKRSNKKNA